MRVWGDGHFHHNHINHCDKHYHLAKRGEQLSQKAFQEFCRCLPLMPRTARLLRRPGITEKEKVIVCSKHQELERKGKWLNLNAFFNSWKCLFWIFENILLLSLGSTYIQRGDHTEGYEMCGCVCGGGYCGEIRIRVETNTHPYEGKYCLPGGGEICVGQYLQYIHYARRPHLFFLKGIKGTVALITIIIKTSFVDKSITTSSSIQVQ